MTPDQVLRPHDFGQEFGLQEVVVKYAENISSSVFEIHFFCGKKPSVIYCSSVFISCLQNKKPVRIKELSRFAKIKDSTIKKMADQICEYLSIEIDESYYIYDNSGKKKMHIEVKK